MNHECCRLLFKKGFEFFRWVCYVQLLQASVSYSLADDNDLISPRMVSGEPAAGIRVRQTAPEYTDTEVYHSLYLPTNWEPGKRYPVIVEYTGNHFPASGSSGEVQHANLGYGLSGGRDFLWIVFPCISKEGEQNALIWWGDRQATINYCKLNLPRLCEKYGGDRDNILLCGFSRGAIAVSYLGLADDEIASLWKCFLTHDHFDGDRSWNYSASDRASALRRLKRLNGRPVLVCDQNASRLRQEYLTDYLDFASFTFLDVPTAEIFRIPEGKVINSHTDLWLHRNTPYREFVRNWVFEHIEVNPSGQP